MGAAACFVLLRGDFMKIDSRKIKLKLPEDNQFQDKDQGPAQTDVNREYRILMLVEAPGLKQKIIREMADFKCHFYGYEDYEDAVENLLHGVVDLILLDSHCENLDAFEFLKVLHERHVKVPTLMLVGSDNAKVKQEALRLGVFDFIQKPLDTIIFRKTVELAFENGKKFLENFSSDLYARRNYQKVEVEIEEKTLGNLDHICARMKISRETYVQKAIQKAMTGVDRTTNPSNFWISQIVTGVTWIDDQHYLLLMQIQEITALYTEGGSNERLHDVFKFLNHYVEVHFHQEEQMFYLLPASEHEEHLAQHRHFEQKMLELDSELKAQKSSAAVIELSVYCQKWFINHIRLIDQNLVARMKEASII